MNFYKSLNFNQRIALKEITHLICGISWDDLGKLFTPRERLELIEQKLILEGYEIVF